MRYLFLFVVIVLPILLLSVHADEYKVGIGGFRVKNDVYMEVSTTGGGVGLIAGSKKSLLSFGLHDDGGKVRFFNKIILAEITMKYKKENDKRESAINIYLVGRYKQAELRIGTSQTLLVFNF